MRKLIRSLIILAPSGILVLGTLLHGLWTGWLYLPLGALLGGCWLAALVHMLEEP